jgi:hypothetical protein
VELHGGSVVDAGLKNKYFCFELVEADNVKRVTLAARNKGNVTKKYKKFQLEKKNKKNKNFFLP